MKSLQDLDIFVRTVDSGSLSATARALGLTPAAASAALKRLESELGVALFARSTRSLRLTQEGELFLEQCRPALAALHQVRGQLQGGRASALTGTLQLAAPSDLGRNVLRNEAQKRVDVALAKQTQMSESVSMELRWEVFNVLNNVNFATPGNDLQDSGDLGVISNTVGGPRVMQFGVRLGF